MSAISGSRTSACRPCAERLGDRLEIDLGLARAGDAVEQEGRELAGVDRRRRSAAAASAWAGSSAGGSWSGSGIGEGIVDRDLDRLDRARLDQAADHAVRDAADDRKLADQPLALADPLQRLRPLRGQPLGHMAGRAIFGDRCARPRARRSRQRHAQHRRERREIIIRGPFDQPAQRRGERRHDHRRGAEAAAGCRPPPRSAAAPAPRPRRSAGAAPAARRRSSPARPPCRAARDSRAAPERR